MITGIVVTIGTTTDLFNKLSDLFDAYTNKGFDDLILDCVVLDDEDFLETEDGIEFLHYLTLILREESISIDYVKKTYNYIVLYH